MSTTKGEHAKERKRDRKMTNIISAKKMEETYVTYGLDNETWEMFYRMRNHDLIDHETWNKFYDKCHGYTYGDEMNTTIVNQYGVVVYRMDEQGYFKKTV